MLIIDRLICVWRWLVHPRCTQTFSTIKDKWFSLEAKILFPGFSCYVCCIAASVLDFADVTAPLWRIVCHTVQWFLFSLCWWWAQKLEQALENLFPLFCRSASDLALRAQSSANKRFLMMWDLNLVSASSPRRLNNFSINMIFDVDSHIPFSESINQYSRKHHAKQS